MRASPGSLAFVAFGAAAFSVAVTSTAAAQESPPSGESRSGPSLDAMSGQTAPPPAGGGDAMAASAPREDSGSPAEREGRSYTFLGARFRILFVPIWLQSLFTHVEDTSVGSASGVNFGYGAEFTYRKNNFDIVIAAWYAGYRNGPAIYWGRNDDIHAANWTENGINGAGGLGVIFLNAEFLWSTPINDMIAFVYGASIGIGIVTGQVMRWEAYQDPTTGAWQKCPTANPSFDPSGTWCDSGGHYNVPEANIPPVIPWVALPQIGLRIKPHRNVMFRVDGGFGIGFFLEAAASFGF